LKASQWLFVTAATATIRLRPVRKKPQHMQKVPVPQRLPRIDTFLIKDASLEFWSINKKEQQDFSSLFDPNLLQIVILGLAAAQKLCGKCDPNDTGEGS
jgi:hypothetical protein